MVTASSVCVEVTKSKGLAPGPDPICNTKALGVPHSVIVGLNTKQSSGTQFLVMGQMVQPTWQLFHNEMSRAPKRFRGFYNKKNKPHCPSSQSRGSVVGYSFQQMNEIVRHLYWMLYGSFQAMENILDV